ncbi:MAG: CBS domain-containing protein [Nitrospirae bacterium]|nr:CBS domain-containing protein [Nitrospirota bacterium]
MSNVGKQRLSGTITPSKGSNTDHPPRRKRSGIYLESTEAEQLGVLPHECIRVKDVMSRSPTIVTPSTGIGEAVQLMKSLGVGAVIVCDGSTLVGTLSDRDIALAGASPSEPIYKVITSNSVYCYENDLLLDVHAMMCTHTLTALPVRDSSGLFSGIMMRAV